MRLEVRSTKKAVPPRADHKQNRSFLHNLETTAERTLLHWFLYSPRVNASSDIQGRSVTTIHLIARILMSIISPQHTSPLSQLPQPDRAPKASSYPASASTPLAPSLDATQAHSSLNDVNALLTPTNLNRIMRNPHSKESREIIDLTRSTLSPANLRSMLQGPNAQANAQVLETIGHKLGKDQLAPSLSSAKNAVTKHQINLLELQALNNLTRLIDADGSDGVLNTLLANDIALDNLQQKFSNIDSTAKSFSDLGGLLTKNNLDALRSPSGIGHASRGPDTANPNAGNSSTQVAKISF